MYAEPKKGESFKLYVFDRDGYHRGPQWFTSGEIRYPHEEITAETALAVAGEAFRQGLEIRVTDSGDMLVFHGKDAQIVYPAGTETIEAFWTRL